jgi:hypothetical protein
MATQLDIDDVAATSELAKEQLEALRVENRLLRELHRAERDLINCMVLEEEPSGDVFKRIEKARAALED